jgi:hypothetical protein
MIYFFSNTTSYYTFYAFFSSFRITLWPTWLANSKRQPCVYPPQSHAQEGTQNWKKWQTWWETCAVPQNIRFSFSCSLFARFKLDCVGLCTSQLKVIFVVTAVIASNLMKFTDFKSRKIRVKILRHCIISYLRWVTDNTYQLHVSSDVKELNE